MSVTAVAIIVDEMIDVMVAIIVAIIVVADEVGAQGLGLAVLWGPIPALTRACRHVFRHLCGRVRTCV